jgi:transposase
MEELKRIIKEQARLIEEQAQIIKVQAEEIRLLNLRIADLERRLGLNSDTSSKPPSSDGLRGSSRPPISSRGSGKPKGGQKGHKGATLEQVLNPDEIIIHKVSQCSVCQSDLSQTPVLSAIKRQEFDVEIRRKVTEHQAQVKKCQCGSQTVACFPNHITAPTQLGENLIVYALCLSYNFIPKDRLSQTMEDLFGIPISDTTIMSYESKLSENLRPFYNHSLTYTQSIWKS